MLNFALVKEKSNYTSRHECCTFCWRAVFRLHEHWLLGTFRDPMQGRNINIKILLEWYPQARPPPLVILPSFLWIQQHIFCLLKFLKLNLLISKERFPLISFHTGCTLIPLLLWCLTYLLQDCLDSCLGEAAELWLYIHTGVDHPRDYKVHLWGEIEEIGTQMSPLRLFKHYSLTDEIVGLIPARVGTNCDDSVCQDWTETLMSYVCPLYHTGKVQHIL